MHSWRDYTTRNYLAELRSPLIHFCVCLLREKFNRLVELPLQAARTRSLNNECISEKGASTRPNIRTMLLFSTLLCSSHSLLYFFNFLFSPTLTRHSLLRSLLSSSLTPIVHFRFIFFFVSCCFDRNLFPFYFVYTKEHNRNKFSLC